MRGPGLLRFSLWWQHIVPPVLAGAYLAVATQALPPGRLAALLPLFVVSIVGIAGFGYFLNDVCDIGADRAAGKANAAAGRKPLARAAILLGLLLLGLAPWSLLPRHPVTAILPALEVGVLTIYSARSLRLKERGLAGVLADTLYGHLLPVAIALVTFFPEPLTSLASARGSRRAALILVLAGVVLACKGLRNIARGPVRTLDLIHPFLLPVEVGALAAVLGLLAPTAPVWAGFAAFLAFTALMFSAWKFPYLPRRQLRFKFLYFLNDFYEEWLPPTALGIAVARHAELWPLLPLHFALFPRGLAKIPRNFAVLRENLANAADF